METKISQTDFKVARIPDVAIVARKNAPVHNRFVPYCSVFRYSPEQGITWNTQNLSSCFVSAHMPFTATDEELKIRMEDLKKLVATLKIKGFKKAVIAGDFNTKASNNYFFRKLLNFLYFSDKIGSSVKERKLNC